MLPEASPTNCCKPCCFAAEANVLFKDLHSKKAAYLLMQQDIRPFLYQKMRIPEKPHKNAFTISQMITSQTIATGRA